MKQIAQKMRKEGLAWLALLVLAPILLAACVTTEQEKQQTQAKGRKPAGAPEPDTSKFVIQETTRKAISEASEAGHVESEKAKSSGCH